MSNEQRLPESPREKCKDPIGAITTIAEEREWAFDQRNDKELSAQIPGGYCDYTLYFSWNEELQCLHFTCALDIRVPSEKRTTTNDLLGLINEKLWLGHFSLWADEGTPMFRHALLLHGFTVIPNDMIDTLVATAVSECDRFYPAIQHLLWGGKTPTEALECAIIDTVGEA